MPSRRRLRTWNNHLFAACGVYRPERAGELAPAVLAPEARDCIARGLGRSYSDCHLNGGGAVVQTERLDGMLEFDAEQGILRCESGVTLGDIIDCLLPRGFFPPVSPGTRFVTVGGAIANDVHGKNHHRDGSIVDHLLEFTLLKGDGRVIRCSREENTDAFWATVGGLGLTGVIMTARLRLQRVESGYLNVDYVRAADLDDALQQFSAGDEHYQYSVAWIDGLARKGALGRAVLMRGNHATAADLRGSRRLRPFDARKRRRPSIPFYLPRYTLNAATVRAFNRAFYQFHPDRAGTIVPYDDFFYPLDAIGNWYRVYGRRGFVQFQVVFPAEASRRALIALLERISKSRRASFLAVLKAMGPASDGLLSFPMPGHTLALDMANTGDDLAAFMGGLNEMAGEHGGRIYLAKDGFATPAIVARMYPKLQRFKEIKRKLDPAGRFSSSLARRVGLVEAS
jgi:FAD/FMN-containing dehydrogenase